MGKRKSFFGKSGFFALFALAAAVIFAAWGYWAHWGQNNKVLKIGFVGVTSGPAAAWGNSNVRSMQTRAEWLNELGGVKIGGQVYDIEIITFDDRKDPQRAIAGMEKMAREGIRYVVGPNVDDAALAVGPIAEKNGIMYFPYAFPKELYRKPASNAVLGMIATYQSAPIMYGYLKEKRGVEKVAFLAPDDFGPMSQRDGGVLIAKGLGLEIVSADVTYGADVDDFAAVLAPIVRAKPDLLVMSSVYPGDLTAIIRTLRKSGYEGLISTEASQDAAILEKGPGKDANGLVFLGGAAPREMASDLMKEFVARYVGKFGEYNDESNTKVYALEYILETLKAEPEAIDDVGKFQEAMDGFEAPNPWLKGGGKLKYIGMTSFGQKRQIFVPMVISEYRDGEINTLFVTETD